MLDIAAGGTFDFQFDIPRNHAPGLNWYHPHPHGHGTRQMFGGIAGAVIFRSAAERRGAAASMPRSSARAAGTGMGRQR